MQGLATVDRAGASTVINQSTDRAAINWQSFNIGANESVRFAQPSASSITLNRVLGQNPTEILGALSANGQIFLLNPNGVLFGQGAQVNVGGLVASTLSLSNEDFMAGRYRFAKDGAAGAVSNAGNIIANGGYVALIGPQVKNQGTIVATSGSVALAAGDQVTLNLNGNKLIGLAVDKGALNALADNKGFISAGGGQVILTAKAADQLIKSVVNNDGIIEAATLSNVNGVIRLEGDNITNSGALLANGSATQNGGSITLAAANDITFASSSILSASGVRGGDITVQASTQQSGGTLLADGRIEAIGSDGIGGTVKLLGDRVGLVNAASIDASGKTGGGTVLVGGDFQGLNPDLPNATVTYAGADSHIKADALDTGNGGKVILWADDSTRFYGNISARGGGNGGAGGFVEVSGKNWLDFNGAVDTSAAQGAAGLLLLDPTNITISNAVTANGTCPPAGPCFTLTGNPATATLNIANLLSALANNNVTVNTASTAASAGNIAVNNAIAYAGATPRTLTLTANNNITFAAGANITSTASALNLTLNATAGAGTITTLRNMGLNGGTLTLNATGAVTQAGVISGTGTSVVKQGAGTFTASQTNTYTGATDIQGGTVAVTAVAGLGTVAGGTTVANGATLNYGTTATFNAEALTLNAGSTLGRSANNPTMNGTINLAGNSTITGAAGTFTLGGVISGTGNLAKTGAGTVTLGGVNTYTGATTISAGTLALNATGTIAASSGVANAGTFSIAANKTIDSLTGAGATTLGANTLTIGDTSNTSGIYTGVASGAGGITTAGTGTLTLGGVNTYTGATTIGAGSTLALNATGTIAASSGVANGGTLSIAAAKTIDSMTGAGATTLGGTLTIGDASNTSSNYTGVTSGAGGITKAGTGTLILGGANTYTGATTINAGTLRVAGGSGIGDGSAVTLANTAGAILDLNGTNETIGSLAGGGATGGNVTLGAGTLTTGGNNTTTTYTGVVSGAGGGLTKAGTGTLTLSGNNTYTSTTTVNAGTLLANNANALGSATGGTTVNPGGTLALNAFTVAEPLTLSGGTLSRAAGNPIASGGVTLTGATTNTVTSAAGTLTLSGVVSGAGNLTKTGAGAVVLSGNNTYTGATAINAGTLRVAGGNGIGNGSAVTLANTAGAILDLNGTSETIGSLAGGGAAGGNVTLGAGTLTTGGDNTTTAYAGAISGAGGLAKTGTGTQTLSGNNAYTGATAVNAGTLSAASANALGGVGTGTTVTGGATLNVNAVALAAEPVTLNGAGGGGNGALTGTGNASLAGTVTLASASTFGTTSAASTMTLGGVVNAAGLATDIRGAGNVTATNAANNFNTVTITNAGSVSLRDANAISLGASTLTGNLTVQAAGNLTLNGLVSAGGAGNAVTLAGLNFINNVGAGALSTPGGRWLVYANTHTGNTFGGLASANQAVWGTAYPAAIAQSGNRYVFANSPALTVTSVNQNKTYGQDGAPIVANAYTVAGFVDATAFGNVFTQDTQANTVTGNATSTGSITTANVGSYAIDVTPVTAADSTGGCNTL